MPSHISSPLPPTLSDCTVQYCPFMLCTVHLGGEKYFAPVAFSLNFFLSRLYWTLFADNNIIAALISYEKMYLYLMRRDCLCP